MTSEELKNIKDYAEKTTKYIETFIDEQNLEIKKLNDDLKVLIKYIDSLYIKSLDSNLVDVNNSITDVSNNIEEMLEDIK